MHLPNSTFVLLSQFGTLQLYQVGIFASRVDAMKNRLKFLRQSKWYTQLKVSLDLYLTQNSISRYETGECGADYELLVRFADYYNLLINFIRKR